MWKLNIQLVFWLQIIPQDKWYLDMIKIQNEKELSWWLKQFKLFYLIWKPTALDKFVVQERHLVDESI